MQLGQGFDDDDPLLLILIIFGGSYIRGGQIMVITKSRTPLIQTMLYDRILQRQVCLYETVDFACSTGQS